ncbi:MAG: ImmA/IrrE family metallo-endopeptidase [Actinomycetota bacterium]
MDTWIEERAEAIRLALGISGCPNSQDLLRLVDWVGTVRLRWGDTDLASCSHRPGGWKVITLPAELAERELTLPLAHEVGHALLSLGAGSMLRQLAPADFRVERLARRWDAQDERRANDFVLAWLLPSRLVARASWSVWELAELANVSAELVSLRRRQLRGRVVELTTAPRWSAALVYHAVVYHGGAAALQVVRRGSIAPVFDFPAWKPHLDRDALQVNADLVALTPTEFELKYEAFRCGAPELLAVDFSALRDRAARRAL